ncbi:MAG: GNAT family N-acetyltransferase [Clostridiales bacterium]|nr:GNAT family N-acetyltransferase [Clostridiales bacterium]
MIQGKFVLSGGDTDAVMALRRSVFVDEQGYSPDIEADEHDGQAVYALVRDEQGDAVATGRMYLDDDELKLGRICVRRDARGQGLGDLVVRMLLYRAEELGFSRVWLSSQLPVVNFYARYGFVPVGEVYREEGVPHQKMRLTLAERTEPPCRARA